MLEEIGHYVVFAPFYLASTVSRRHSDDLLQGEEFVDQRVLRRLGEEALRGGIEGHVE